MNIAEHTKDHTDQSEIIDDIITRLLHQNPAEAFYAKIEQESKRTICIHLPLHSVRDCNFICLDVDAEQVKTFAVERFHKFKETDTIILHSTGIQTSRYRERLIWNH